MKGYRATKTAGQLMLGGFILFCWVQGVSAADETGNWRSTYDTVLLWVNFVIFVFIAVKYARTPLKNFLHGRKGEIERQIQKLEQEKEIATSNIQQMIAAVEENKTRFAEMKQKIIAQGETKKQEIISDGRLQSRMMLEEAKRKIDNQILQVKNQFKAELVDAAIELATERLPREITPQDNQKFIQLYLEETRTS